MPFTPNHCPSCGKPTIFFYKGDRKGYAYCPKGHRHPATIINYYTKKGAWKRTLQGTRAIALPAHVRIQQWFYAANHSFINYLGRFF